MTRQQMDDLIALHDRWSLYDAAIAILTFGAGVLLLVIGVTAAINGADGLGVMVTIGGAAIALFGLHKEPYQAR